MKLNENTRRGNKVVKMNFFHLTSFESGSPLEKDSIRQICCDSIHASLMAELADTTRCNLLKNRMWQADVLSSTPLLQASCNDFV